MPGASLTQTGGSGIINSGGTQNPSPFTTVLTGISCALAGVGFTPTSWALGVPTGSATVLSSTTAVAPSFTPDIAGNYEVVAFDASLNVYTLQLIVARVAATTFTGPIQPAHLPASNVATPAVGVALWSDSTTLNAPSVKFTDASTAPLAVARYGTTAARPTTGLYTDYQYFDTTLGIPIWWSGSAWVNSSSATPAADNGQFTVPNASGDITDASVLPGTKILTSDASATKIVSTSSLNRTIPSNSVASLQFTIVGYRTGGGAAGSVGDSASFVRTSTVRNIAGTLTIRDTVDSYSYKDDSAWGSPTVTIDGGTNVAINALGLASANITWTGEVSMLRLTP